MEGSSHRDLVPIGSRLRRHVYKHVEVGVYTPMDEGSDGEDPEGDFEWKSRVIQFSMNLPVGFWNYQYVAGMDRGFSEYSRTGRKIRCVGLDMVVSLRLSSLMTGTMIGTGADFGVTMRPNGPASTRVLLLVNKGPSTYPGPAEDVFVYSTILGTGFEPEKFDGYVCIFDKTYEFGAMGGTFEDHVYIDCDFVIVYPEADDGVVVYPLFNDVEIRSFNENGVNTSISTSYEVRLWYEDY